jgi:histidinol-phosphatase (PHP family)
MRTDVHAHTAMVDAAEGAGLDALGLTDHCIVTEDAFGRRARYDLVETYERRRTAIGAARAETDLTLYDAAEVSFAASETDAIREFLSTADFDYTIGSVHFAGEYDYTADAPYADADDESRRAAIERYYDAVVALVESELFDVLGHLDLPERRAALRGFSRPENYERVAAALATEMLSPFCDRGVEFVLGTDSHRPDELTRRVPALKAVADETDAELVGLESILS